MLQKPPGDAEELVKESDPGHLQAIAYALLSGLIVFFVAVAGAFFTPSPWSELILGAGIFTITVASLFLALPLLVWLILIFTFASNGTPERWTRQHTLMVICVTVIFGAPMLGVAGAGAVLIQKWGGALVSVLLPVPRDIQLATIVCLILVCGTTLVNLVASTHILSRRARGAVHAIATVVPNQTEGRVCAKCGELMVLRTAERGVHAGEQFWGCSDYPTCRYAELA